MLNDKIKKKLNLKKLKKQGPNMIKLTNNTLFWFLTRAACVFKDEERKKKKKKYCQSSIVYEAVISVSLPWKEWR